MKQKLYKSGKFLSLIHTRMKLVWTKDAGVHRMCVLRVKNINPQSLNMHLSIRTVIKKLEFYCIEEI